MEYFELEHRAVSFIDRFLAANDQTRNAMRTEGAALADRLHLEAVDLSMARATEFSPEIPLYELLAAKVALLVYWPDVGALRRFERQVFYYRIFASTRYLVEDYQRFREAYTGSRGVEEID